METNIFIGLTTDFCESMEPKIMLIFVFFTEEIPPWNLCT